MSPDELILLVINFAKDQKIRGKTLLQKRIYFLTRLLPKLETSYKPHYFGPYAGEVDEGLDQLKSLGFIDEKTLGFGVAGEMGFEVKRYDYEVTEDGKEVVEYLKSQFLDECQKIEENLTKLSESGDTGDYVSLSIAAKCDYILRNIKEQQTVTYDDMKQEAKKLGWDITDKSIDKACDFLAKLGFIQGKEN